MPYQVSKRGSKWAVITQGTDRVHGLHPTEAAAMAQMRALYASTRYEVVKSGDSFHVIDHNEKDKVVGRHGSEADATAQARSLNAAAKRRYQAKKSSDTSGSMFGAPGMLAGWMGYSVLRTEDGSFAVIGSDGPDRPIGEYATEAEAMAKVLELMAEDIRAGKSPLGGETEGAATPEPGTVMVGGKSLAFDDPGEIWVYGGDAVKSVGSDGAVGGYLIRWGSPDEPDATSFRDYFTPESDLGRFVRGPLDLLFHHGLPNVKGRPNDLADDVIGEATVRPDAEGLWLDGRLDLTNPRVARLWDEIKADDCAYGLSSGAVSHYVKRERKGSGAHWLRRWWVAEASITPTPGEPRTSVIALKSLVVPAGVDSAPSWLDQWEACLETVSALKAELVRYAKVGPSKIEAVRELRDSLSDFLKRHDPRRVDPGSLDAARAAFERLNSRLGSSRR